MHTRKSRNEINLSRLLSRCLEMANTASDLSAEWRIPKFVSAAEAMFCHLPMPPDPLAPSPDQRLEYQNQLQFLQTICRQIEMEERKENGGDLGLQSPGSGLAGVPSLPHGPALTRDTVSKQIYQKASERAGLSQREQLLRGARQQDLTLNQDQGLESLLAAHRDQQEKVAEEMLGLTRRLKEQSLVARTIVQEDVKRLESTNTKMDDNLAKLQEESGRISHLANRWNCRCWIWLAMAMVILTFVGMVLVMKLFKKRLPPPPPVLAQDQLTGHQEL